jgi:16S rRNA (cytosine1402-N4)-methyltransferase
VSSADPAQPKHIPVLPVEVLAALSPQPGQVAIDCTAGLGGHAEAIARAVGPTGTVLLCDLDAGNLARAADRLRSIPAAGAGGGGGGGGEGGGGGPPKVLTHHGSFAEAPRELLAAGLRADLVLADLGFASPQVEDAQRGFSFSRDGPLDMRLDPTRGSTAADLVATLPERELADLIYRFGEERESRAIARRIVQTRASTPITRTGQLAELIRSVVRRTPGGIDPATRTFQALRIAVNDELGHLDALLDWIDRGARPQTRDSWLAPGARVAIIAFHSLEDRPVKQAFGRLVERGLAEPVIDGMVGPTDAERQANPRAGSAKLRAVRIVGTPGSGRASPPASGSA